MKTLYTACISYYTSQQEDTNLSSSVWTAVNWESRRFPKLEMPALFFAIQLYMLTNPKHYNKMQVLFITKIYQQFETILTEIKRYIKLECKHKFLKVGFKCSNVKVVNINHFYEMQVLPC